MNLRKSSGTAQGPDFVRAWLTETTAAMTEQRVIATRLADKLALTGNLLTQLDLLTVAVARLTTDAAIHAHVTAEHWATLGATLATLTATVQQIAVQTAPVAPWPTRRPGAALGALLHTLLRKLP